jgi:hypothetical protein
VSWPVPGGTQLHLLQQMLHILRHISLFQLRIGRNSARRPLGWSRPSPSPSSLCLCRRRLAERGTSSRRKDKTQETSVAALGEQRPQIHPNKAHTFTLARDSSSCKASNPNSIGEGSRGFLPSSPSFHLLSSSSLEPKGQSSLHSHHRHRSILPSFASHLISWLGLGREANIHSSHQSSLPCRRF